eukprot:CAMPEP_0118877846 /NCGR_PEP_ID=MMETSP1163-20130328/17991_1 /TAXON_ID=124430 /ORGANISM="Phaeomonas parva, Strain CCMP2877" /LENGTH=59 /DNA_ID=CAMNT_0006813605 /DNA_START=54 /DNA_END=233 /DNA_ORIENTATION=+
MATTTWNGRSKSAVSSGFRECGAPTPRCGSAMAEAHSQNSRATLSVQPSTAQLCVIQLV